MHIALTYFDFPFWRAEVSRLALHIGGVDFEDRRPSREAFRAMKAAGQLPYGQLPVLEVDGVIIAQSAAIARYCGKLSGLYPMSDHVAAARVDELLDAANEVTLKVSPTMREQDPTRRAAMRTELATETFPAWFEQVEGRVDDGEFLVGDALTIADLALWRLLAWLTGGFLDGIPTDLLDRHPRLSRHVATIAARGDVTAWMTRYDRVG